MNKKQHTILWNLLKSFVTLRDGQKCVVCGKKMRGLNLSHIFPRGQYPRLEFEPLNVFLQCPKHHLFWWHKNPIEAADWYNKTIPLTRRKKLLSLIKNYDKIKPIKYEICLGQIQKSIKEIKK